MTFDYYNTLLKSNCKWLRRPISVIHTRDNGGLDHCGSNGDDEKWLYFGHTLKVESMGFPN